MDFLVDRVGFRLQLISPADRPRVAVVEGHGTRLRLEVDDGDRAQTGTRIRLVTPHEPPGPIEGPGGLTVEVVADRDGPSLPPARPRFELSRYRPSDFAGGRASMGYRDLLPDRQGGRYIASHIRIPKAGPVPDYVHYHRIRFQLIYCLRGWVRVVYEDQGPPFVLEPGDAVLQAPEIRHRVLECSPGLDVLEVGCPAEHDTFADHELALPTAAVRPDRRYGGQRFVRHRAAEAATETDPASGLAWRDLGLTDATGGLARGRVVRPRPPGQPTIGPAPGAEFHFLYLTAGRVTLRSPDGSTAALGPDDAVALAPDSGHRLTDWSADAQAVELLVPAP